MGIENLGALVVLAIIIGIAALVFGIIIFCLLVKFIVTVPRHLSAIADALDDIANK